MKKAFSIVAASAVCAACFSAAAYAEIGASALNDGVYSVEVESDSSMFKVVNCEITVDGGKMTATVTLSRTGYGKLFLGTGEQAAAADESEHIPFTEDAEGKYVYTFELSALDTEIDVAAWSIKNSAWYDRKLTFKSNSLPESAHNPANGGLTPDPIRPDQTDRSDESDDLGQNNQSNQQNQTDQSGDRENSGNPDQSGNNPNTGGLFGIMGITMAAAGVAVVFARKKQ